MYFKKQSTEKRWLSLTESQQRQILIIITKAEYAARGELYATEAEYQMILNDPFAFTSMNLTSNAGEQILRLSGTLLKAIAEARS